MRLKMCQEVRAKLPLSHEVGTRIDSAARREPRPPGGTRQIKNT
jgi:hypothetical protein